MVMPLLHHTLPTVATIGVTGEVAKKVTGKTKKRKVKIVAKKRKPTKPIKQKPKAKVTTTRSKATKSALSKGKWAQLSRQELVHIIGKGKADKVKAANGKAVKIGMYDKAIYINGKYYLSID